MTWNKLVIKILGLDYFYRSREEKSIDSRAEISERF